ncbi:outer membrane beta-barrel protein [Flavobacterium sp.]|uniref:outer membrane beta-barrel protein n=1 Tax=Flavobacterium sp. TaxID=239 RepID=UPI0032631729
MKKLLLIIALAIFSYANAQEKSILVMVSGTYFSENISTSGNDIKQTSFGFAPKIGYQYHENWTGGLEASIVTIKQNTEGNTNYEYKYNTVSLGGFLRYSKSLNETFSIYSDLGVGFQNKKEMNTSEEGKSPEGFGYYVALTPAILINVTNGFALNFNIGSLGYNTLNYNSNNNINLEAVKKFNFTLGQAFTIGISKNF